MRLNYKGYCLREVAGEYMLICEDASSVDFNNIYSLTPSAAWLWNSLGEDEFDDDAAVSAVRGEYGLDEDTARTDVRDILDQWRECGMLL